MRHRRDLDKEEKAHLTRSTAKRSEVAVSESEASHLYDLSSESFYLSQTQDKFLNNF